MDLSEQLNLPVYPKSVVKQDGITYFLTRTPSRRRLGFTGDAAGFEGRYDDTRRVWLCHLTESNAATLRAKLPWLNPQPLGLRASAGCGDRLGLATPGHIRAVCATGSAMQPILAQQSMRENARTGRTPQEVMDDAMWGVFQEGWRGAWGADADHLKTPADIDLCLAAGYTFYTVDPGAYVDNAAHDAPLETLRSKLPALPWDALQDTPDSLRARYLGQPFAVETHTLAFDETTLLRAACKYGGAIAHTASMYRHLVQTAGEQPVELEVSVDETDTPTSPLEHYFIASELRRLGVTFVSLAPRYTGSFEKGVDYIGDVAQFEAEFAVHAAIARALGPYKLSLHSGSDKFTIYPIVARHAGELVHLKTAGTSYLEALRAIAGAQPGLFREILALAHARYDTDKVSYHVSADAGKVPQADDLTDAQLEGVLDLFDGRQMLHVTFGSALERFGTPLKQALAGDEEAYYAVLETHFIRHLQPFSK